MLPFQHKTTRRKCARRRRVRSRSKVLRVCRHPSRNVSTRIPVLGYASGGISSTVRVTLPPLTSNETLNQSWPFRLSFREILLSSYNLMSLIPIVYSNVRINRFSVRIIPLVSSYEIGGNHTCVVYPRGVSSSIFENTDFRYHTSQAGAVTSVFGQTLATQWVPTSPSDLNYGSFDDLNFNIVYCLSLATAIPFGNSVSQIIIDVDFTSRTFSNNSDGSVRSLRNCCDELDRLRKENEDFSPFSGCAFTPY